MDVARSSIIHETECSYDGSVFCIQETSADVPLARSQEQNDIHLNIPHLKALCHHRGQESKC